MVVMTKSRQVTCHLPDAERNDTTSRVRVRAPTLTCLLTFFYKTHSSVEGTTIVSTKSSFLLLFLLVLSFVCVSLSRCRSPSLGTHVRVELLSTTHLPVSLARCEVPQPLALTIIAINPIGLLG